MVGKSNSGSGTLNPNANRSAEQDATIRRAKKRKQHANGAGALSRVTAAWKGCSKTATSSQRCSFGARGLGLRVP